MNKYSVLVMDGDKVICRIRVEAENEEEAQLKADFSMVCHLPNMKYDTLHVIPLNATERGYV